MAYEIGPKIGIEGEKEFRDGIKSINETMKTLGTEMKAVTSQFDKNDNSVEALTAKNEVLNKQIELQKQKLAELAKGLDISTEKYGENDTITQGWQRSINEATAKLNNMERELGQNNETIEKATSSTDDLNEEVKDIAENTENAGAKTDEYGQKLKANLTSAAVIAGVVALGKAVKEVAQGTADLARGSAAYADDMLTLSAQTGVTTKTLQELKYMQELTDVSLEDVTKTMARNIRGMYNAQKGTEDYVKAYAKLGVQVTNTDGSLRDSESVYWDMIDALGQMENQTEADAVAMLLFGRSAQDLNPLIAIGSQGVKEFADEAQRMGAVLSEEALDALGEVDDKLQRANQTMEIAKRKIGAELAPAFASATEKIANKVSDMDDEFASFAGGGLDLVVGGLEFIIDNRKPIIAGLTGITAGIVAFKVGSAGVAVASSAMSLFGKTTKTAAAAQTTLNAAQAASPMGLIATAIGLAAGGMTLAAQNAAGLTDEYKKFNKEISQSLDLIESEIGARKEKKELLIAEHNEYGNLTDKLYELSAAENKSNEEKTNMVVIVDQLNKAIPNLNLSINKETGSLNKQKSEVNGLIEATLKLYQVKAAQEDLSTISEAKYKADRDRQAIQKRIVEDEIKLAEAEKKYFDEYYDHFFVWSNAGAYKNITQIKNGLVESRGELERTDQAIADLGKEWDYAMKYISDNGELLTSTDEIGNAILNTANKYKDATGQMGYYLHELRDKIGALKDEYATALEDKAKEIKNTFSLFEDATMGEASGTTLVDNLQSQLNTMQEWADDMAALGNKGLSKGLINELEAMGIGAASEINALNDLTDEELQKYNKLWQEKGQLATKLATKELEQLKVETDAQLAELEDIYNQRGEAAANSYIKGLHDVIDDKKLAIRAEMQGLLDADTAAAGYDSNYSFYGPVQKGTTGDNTSWMDNLKVVVENIMKNYSPTIVMDGDKVGELTSNRMAREMYTK